MTSHLPPLLGVFDLETTGISTENDRIVTAFVGELDADGNLIAGREWMVRPDGYVIPEGATAIHGVTTERATAEGRPLAEVLPEIVGALVALAERGAPVATHNGAYDFTLLAHEMHRAGMDDPVRVIDTITVIDTMVLDKQIDKWRRGSRTLTATAAVYGVALSDEDAHGAAADAIAAGKIALALLGLPALTGFTVDKLRRLQASWAREQRASFVAYKRRNGEPDFDTDLNWPLYTSALALRAPDEVYTF